MPNGPILSDVINDGPHDAPQIRRPKRRFPSLREYFRLTGMRQATIASVLGISDTHLSNIVSGKRRPNAKLAIDLSRLTSVPVESIVSPEP